MEREEQRRVAENEALFRDANEAIERGLWPEQEHHVIRFRCECAGHCGQSVELTPHDYEKVREDPQRFIVLDGHELPETEEVLERHPTYLVVRKTGEGGRFAAELDPRS